MRKPIVIILILLAAGGAVLFWMSRRAPAPAPIQRPALLVISGDTDGWITPCGCTANQSGGLLRRGAYLKDLRQSADVLYADAGGAPAGVSPYQRVKFEAVLAGEMAMGISAHNIGGPEALLGPEYLRQTAARLKCPFICANARDSAGIPLAEPMRIVNAGGLRVALVGVLSQRFATADVQVDEPRPAILVALAKARGTYDRVVVLAYLPEDELMRLAQELPEADAIVGGPTGQAVSPRPVAATLLAAATNKGKFIVRLDLPGPASHERTSGSIVEMSPTWADDPAQVANVNQYLAVLGQRNFNAADSGFAPAFPAGAPAGYRVAGSESCRACHASTMQSWSATAHAHAWQTLQPRGYHVDPYCLQCHTTGYGLPGGFDAPNVTPALVGVGCENCHGPSLAHVKDPKAHTPFVAADQCVRCHDHENSPKFDYAPFWGRIEHKDHGRGPATREVSS